MADDNREGTNDHRNTADADPSVELTVNSKQEQDLELDELLDSALEDFDRPPPNVHPPTETKTAHNKEEAAKNIEQHQESNEQSQEAVFEELFQAAELGDEGSKQFQDAMNMLMGQEPELAQQIQKLAQAAGKIDDSEESEQHFTETLQQTLGSLSQNAAELQSELSEEDVLKAMSGLNLEEGLPPGLGEGEMGFMPMMQNMMKTLLSKDVLYPSLKEISTKYPDWLVENKEKLSQTDYDNFSKQNNLMKRICSEFEQEKDGDSAEVKSQRFERIIELMQQMQDCGQPPQDLVGDTMPGMEGGGLPQMPNIPNMNPEQCSLM